MVKGKAVDALVRTTRSKEVADKLAELKLSAYEDMIIDEHGYDSLDAFDGMSAQEVEDIAKECKMKPGHAKKFVSAFADPDAKPKEEKNKPDEEKSKSERTLSFYERREAEEKAAKEAAAQAPVPQVMMVQQPAAAPNVNVAGPNVVVQNTNINKNTNIASRVPSQCSAALIASSWEDASARAAHASRASVRGMFAAAAELCTGRRGEHTQRCCRARRCAMAALTVL